MYYDLITLKCDYCDADIKRDAIWYRDKPYHSKKCRDMAHKKRVLESLTIIEGDKD